MKKIFAIGISAIAFILGGCSSTTITEYDKDGKVVSITKTNADAMSILAQGSKGKDNFIAVNSWAFGANPTANIYGVGSFSAIIGSINKEFGAVNAGSYATMINEAKVKLNLTADKDGIKAKVETNETSVQAPQEKKVEQ
jgi:hypothetical protein